LDPPQTWCLTNLQLLEDEGATIIEGIKNGSAKVVSDGFFKSAKGAAAWVLEGTNEICNLKGTTAVPGSLIDQSAYCSELVGILAALSMTQVLCAYCQIESGSLTMGCENTSAIFLAPDLDIKISTRMADHDILYGIHWTLKNIPIEILWVHVRGHQDDKKEAHQLTRLEELNCEMDSLAKAAVNNIVTQGFMNRSME
jgi:hypothetical protein